MSILAVIILAVNALVAGIGALLAALIFLLPDMPDHPPAVDSGVLGTINWIVPVGQLISVWAIILGLWLTILAIRIALKWVRAL